MDWNKLKEDLPYETNARLVERLGAATQRIGQIIQDLEEAKVKLSLTNIENKTKSLEFHIEIYKVVTSELGRRGIHRWPDLLPFFMLQHDKEAPAV